MTKVIYFLRFVIVLLNLHLPTGSRHFLDVDLATVGLEENLGKNKKKEKRKQVQQTFPIRNRFKKVRLDRRLKSTKPKDHRYSNQRTLRRMYRNS